MNKNNPPRTALVTAIVSGFVALNAAAAEQLSGAQLKDMFSDKTVSATTAQNKTQNTYFSADGKMVQKAANGEKKQGVWRVDAKGQQCITWTGSAEVCSTVVARGDGTYQRLVGDKAVVTIQKMRQGNLLDE